MRSRGGTVRGEGGFAAEKDDEGNGSFLGTERGFEMAAGVGLAGKTCDFFFSETERELDKGRQKKRQLFRNEEMTEPASSTQQNIPNQLVQSPVQQQP